jgi:hypothetical protein
MSDIDVKMQALGNEFEHLKQQYTRGISVYIHNVEPLPEEEFWTLLPKLQNDITTFIKLKRDTKVGCNEFVRYSCFCSIPYNFSWDSKPEDDRNRNLKGWKTAAQFLTSYRKLTSKIYKAIDKMSGLERGDDSFGDLCDSLPLAGKDVISKILSKDIVTYKHLDRALDTACYMTNSEMDMVEKWKKFILHGENYICMSLENALTEYYSHIVAEREDS